MATGHNRFSVVAELNSAVPRKIAAPVSSREGYPELPDISDNPHHYSTPVKEVFLCKLTQSFYTHAYTFMLPIVIHILY
jgi:hypothetical protein